MEKEKSDENDHDISKEAMITSEESDHESFKQATEFSDEVSDQETSSQAIKTDNVCKFCEKLFSRKSHLISHIFKDHTCNDNSNEAFSEKGSLASREIGHLKKELKNEIEHLKKDIIEELKEMFMKQDEKLESLQREILDLKKEHKNESLNNHENIPTPTKRNRQVLKELSPTTTQPSKKSRQETLINEALEDNSDEDSSSEKKSKNKETNDICVKSVSKPKRRRTPRTRRGLLPVVRKKYICINCGKLYQTKHHLESHTCDSSSMTELDARRLRKKIYCNNCGRLYQRKHSLVSHTCDSFPKTELTKTKQDIQGMTVSKKDQNKNDIAEESISIFQENTKISQSEEQIETNSVEKKYICNDCGKTYQSKHDLKSHTAAALHEKQRDHQCTSCGKSFTEARNLINHIHSIHEGQKDYKCSLCDKSFSTWEKLKWHKINVHKRKRNHQCTSCGKSFISAAHLRKHIRTVHERQKDYKCNTCGKDFGERINLNRHIKTVHEGQRDYKCDTCEKEFTTKQTLISHIKRFHEHKCQHCDKTFTTLSILKRHAKVHMEEKPKNQNDHENENHRLTEKTAENETNGNSILDTDIINPSDYKFENEYIVKKEVKEEIIDQVAIKEEAKE